MCRQLDRCPGRISNTNPYSIGIAERGLGAHRFRSGIDQSGGGRRVFRPAWNASPAHQRQFTGGFFRILADDCYRLSGGDVVTRAPVFFPRDGIEVLLDDLLSPRQLAAPALEGKYGRSDERFTRPSKGRGRREKYLSSDLRLDSPRIQQILGNILAVLMLLRPFPQRNRTPIFLF
jgi:hypothetical protein